MRKNKLIGLLLIIMLTGCYTKKRAIEKFCTQDTATATIIVHDTLIVDRILSDTVFSATIDSVIVTKDKLVISYKKVFDKIYLSGEYKGDTVIKIKEVKVVVPCNCPSDTIGFWDNWQYFVYGCLLGIILFALVIVLRRYNPRYWN